MANQESRVLTISGVKVIFPCKPYPSQFSMMDRVIKGLKGRQNSLLESPTGSGKSLALLCSALAWQCTLNDTITRENMQAAENFKQQCTCGAEEANRKMQEFSPSSKPEPGHTVPVKVQPDSPGGASCNKPIEINSDDDDDFQPSGKRRSLKPGTTPGGQRAHVKIEYEKEPPQKTSPPAEKCKIKCICDPDGATTTKKKTKLPKIFFCTRTHKQIAQIVRELGKTEYHDVKMAILASREHCCIHPEVSRMKNKSEGCRERLDGPGCTYNERAKRIFLSQRQLQDALPTSWDLEDLVSACRPKKACPYFVTRNIVDQADIIFCPYNYLIDPLVRKSMDINLKEQVVILDEAHNIEDSARDAGSGSITTEQISQAIQDLNEMCVHNIKVSEHVAWKNLLDRLSMFIEESSRGDLKMLDFDTSFKVWEGFDIVANLKNMGLGPDNFNEYKSKLESIAEKNEDQQESVRNRFNQEVKLHASTLKLLELVVQILDYMYRQDLRFVEDYRVAILKSMQFVARKDTNNVWVSKNRRGSSKVIVYSLNFWCMNPAVAFSDFTSCRSIVLSSGTLSPMATFASELGVPFPIQLEASHVIEDKQVWVGAIGRGPNGGTLEAVYKNKETFSFQDELGNLILKVCTLVPHGVLCFLPSYRDVEKFIQRWKATNLWGAIARRKRIMVEPRASDKEDFDNMMKGFYDVVKGNTCSSYIIPDETYDDDSEIDGALFIAVCRGKVSEGMDFADNNARAVITIGIPFPSIKDLQVQLKKSYNDKHRVSRGLLSGHEWYEIQAFRALNQALGRCIRHRKDWGALIVVDDRFVKRPDRYCKGLSKWVRSKVKTYEHFGHVEKSLTAFTEKMQKEMPVVNPDTSFIPCTPCTPGTSRRHSLYGSQPPATPANLDTSAGSDPNTSIYFSPKGDLGKLLGCSPDLNKPARNKEPSIGLLSTNSVPLNVDKSTGCKIVTPPTNPGNTTSLQPTLIVIPPPGPQSFAPLVLNTVTSPPNVGGGFVTVSQQPGIISILSQPGIQINTPTPPKLIKTSPSGTHPFTSPPLLVANAAVSNTGIDNTTGINAIGKNSTITYTDNKTLTPPSETRPEMCDYRPHPNDAIAYKNRPMRLGVGVLPRETTIAPAELVLPEPVTPLSIQAQLMQAINNGQVPKDRACIVVMNKGKPDETTLLIEPNSEKNSRKRAGDVPKKLPVENSGKQIGAGSGKQTTEDSGKRSEVLGTGKRFTEAARVQSAVSTGRQSTSTTGNVHTGVVPNTSCEQSNVGGQGQAESQPLQGTPEEAFAAAAESKARSFLKFVKVPTPRAKVPIALVTPQVNGQTSLPTTRRSSIEEEAGPSNSDRATNCVSPSLFDDDSQPPTDNDTNIPVSHPEHSAETSTSNPTSEVDKPKRKPLFRKDVRQSEKIPDKPVAVRKSGRAGIDFKQFHKFGTKVQKEQEIDKKDRKKSDSTSSDNEKSDLDHRKSHGTRSAVRVKVSSSVMNQLRKVPRTAVDKQDEKKLKEIKSPVLDVSDMTEGSDEEFLNTRRKGGRKKRSKGQPERGGRKRVRGVVYDEEDEEMAKENKRVSSSVSCAVCGVDWSADAECLRVPKLEFLEAQNKGGQDVLSFFAKDTGSSNLQHHSSDTEGAQLNSIYDTGSKCCVQYLQCRACGKNSRTVGAQVVMADSTSQYKRGQTWILAYAAKT